MSTYPQAMRRRNRIASFRDDQLAHRYDPHIEPVNRLVDELSTDDAWMPYVSPLYGGVEARVLFLFQDPGPATRAGHGSGMLSPENDDPSAEMFADCLAAADLDYPDVITWNAYPWYIFSQRRPSAAMLDEGGEPLRRLIELLPAVRSVCLAGRGSQNGWRRFAARCPSVADSLVAVDTLHPSARGITGGGRHSRDEGAARLVADMRRAAEVGGRIETW